MNQDRVTEILGSMTELLLAAHEEKWSRSLARLRAAFLASTPGSLEYQDLARETLRLYGGMGSFQDLVLQTRSGVSPEQRELDHLRNELFEVLRDSLSVVTADKSFPVAIQRLYTWLIDRGFSVIADRRGGMGGVWLTLTGQISPDPTTSIEISGDRGHWTIGLRFNGMTCYIPTQSWAAYIDGTNASDLGLEQQTAFVENRINDAVSAYMENPAIESDLTRLGEEDMHRRYPRC